MAGSKKSSALIQSIKVRAMIPNNQVTFTDEDFLRFATEELQNSMFAEILRHHEDFFLYSLEVPIEANKNVYRIPARAGGVRLRDVQVRRSSGNLQELTRIEVQDLPHYANNSTGENLSAFYIKNNSVALVPENAQRQVTGATMVFYFYMTPNEMVPETRAATITAIDRNTGEITVDSLPVNTDNTQLITTSTKIDVISQDSPHVCEIFDITPSSVDSATNIVTLATTDIPDTLQVGDILNLAGETIFPQIPAEQHMQLAMRTAMRCMSALGDTQNYQVIKDELEETKKNTTAIIDNRVEGAPRKVVNRNGLLRDGLFKRRFRFRS